MPGRRLVVPRAGGRTYAHIEDRDGIMCGAKSKRGFKLGRNRQVCPKCLRLYTDLTGHKLWMGA